MAAAVLAADPLVVNTPAETPSLTGPVELLTGTMNLERTPQAMNFDGVKEVPNTGTGDRTVDWHTNVPAGTVVFFSVTDAEGQFGRSADFVVEPSGTSCSFRAEHAHETYDTLPQTDNSSCL
ncbi:hypothetical protein TRAPUB_4671 [Trametes pubescens]|uniref:Uncharacterized protein n=1 Tax=Trametes pubescens TaxID=154538 RepID=A0A1M2VAL6_TRAPU|nr:hypothetical protein TRAPUB_4671 [Trametes pubescens]